MAGGPLPPWMNVLSGGSNDDILTGDHRSDILLGAGGNDTLNGVSSNDLLDGGSGNDHLTGGPGPDRFQFRVQYDRTYEIEPFRNGSHPSEHAYKGNGHANKAWQNYWDQARERGYTEVIDHFEGERFYFPLMGKKTLVSETINFSEMDTDTITDFQPGVDTIAFVGVAHHADFLASLSFSGSTLYYDGKALIHLVGHTSFDNSWISFG